MPTMASERDLKAQERINLRNIINQWNANRLDLFELSEPNEDLEFHGVMRFYFQDAGQKVATKCIRVSSTASVKDVVYTLIEKFRPDIRMLSVPDYALYEIHENGDERKLGDEEKPLLVQLNWHRDDREGRFLLRRMDEKSHLPSLNAESLRFGRKLSKREKKEKKKKEKKEKLAAACEEDRKNGLAEKLYTELPETSFTRSISNPEAVMRRRRQQKLEKKLQQFRQEGSTETGGTLRIFGESLNKDVPYKTLLLSMHDTAAIVVKEILEKYAFDKEDPTHYCLVQMFVPHPAPGELDPLSLPLGTPPPGIKEYILDDDDCPLIIERQHNRMKGNLSFHIRRRPADYQPRKRKKKPKPTRTETDKGYKHGELYDKLPFLLEIGPDGSEIGDSPKKHRLCLNMTEIGSERSSSSVGQCLQLHGPGVHPRHCVIAHTEGIVTVTPSSQDAETFVNGVRIYDTTILQHGMVLRFGKHHTYKFIDPQYEQHPGLSPDHYPEFLERKEDHMSQHGSYETTFDAAGNVETISTHSHKSDDAHSHRSLGRESAQGRAHESHDHRRGNDPILPAVLEFWEEHENIFLDAVITHLDCSSVQFKLAPTYTLYMAARYRASTHFRPETTPNDRAHRLTTVMNKVATLIHQVIQERYRDSGSLAFWLANASELLHFLKQDRHLSAYTLDAQDLLAESVQLAFQSLVICQQGEIQAAMPSFLDNPGNIHDVEGPIKEILSVLSNTMSLLRRCRVNAALTIQLFSQLFHYINMWIFNSLVHPETKINLCSRPWGTCLKRRLAHIVSWAEKQGLELAADCHLSRSIQAAHLLQASKSTAEDITAISTACYKLNSLQLRTLFEKYQPLPDEPIIPRNLIESVVKVAENTADEHARSDGRDVKLEEDIDLQLPFLLPEDGYSCDIVRGVPAGLQEFLQPLALSGLCRLTLQPTSLGYWTIYMSDQDIIRPTEMPNQRADGEPSVPSSPAGQPPPRVKDPQRPEPEIATLCLQKSNSGMGLSIVAARGINQDKLGIYIKSVVKGGAADQDGRLQAGDQLLKVDGHSLVGISQEKAAELMTRTGPVVTLEVAKQGAIFHGLAALLCQPSPMMQRGPRRMSERDIPSRVMQDDTKDIRFPPNNASRIQGSKSVPSLNSAFAGQEPQQMFRDANMSNSHDIHNPGYSRTSSSASIPKEPDLAGPDAAFHHPKPNDMHPGMMPPPVKYTAEPPPYPAKPGPRPETSHSSHRQPPSVQEERHYQNISMYQQHPPMPHEYPAPRPPSYQQQFQSRHLHSSHSSLQHSVPQVPQSPNEHGRPLSTLVSPREQEQYVNSLGYQPRLQQTMGPPSPRRPYTDHQQRGPPGYSQVPPQENREWQGRMEHHPSDNESKHSHPEYPPYQDQQLARQQHNPNHHPDPRQDPRHVLRQEAKMEEMKEEVRRREEREHAQQMGRPMPSWVAAGHPQRPGPNQERAHFPPPGKVRPGVVSNRHPEGPDAMPNYPESVHEGGNGYPHPQVSYRYGPSGYPPADASGPPHYEDQVDRFAGGHVDRQQQQGFGHQRPIEQDKREGGGLLSPSPWEREEKERMRRVYSPQFHSSNKHVSKHQQKLEEARKVRDDEIHDLENLPYRTPKQEERLRTLRLEQEFQRRAEEMGGDEEEEDDDELMDRAEKRERILKMQEGLEKARQSRIEWEQQQLQQKPPRQLEDQIRRPYEYHIQSKPPVEEPENRLRQLKLEENSKKMELEAHRKAEERLLREARRRQEEDMMQARTKVLQDVPSHGYSVSSNHVPLDAQDVPPPLPSSPPPLEHLGPSSQQRLDNLVSGSHSLYQMDRPSDHLPGVPAPPERKSSYEVANQLTHGGGGQRYGALKNSNDGSNTTHQPKKVSFFDTHMEVEVAYDTNGNHKGKEDQNLKNSDTSYTLQDIDEVLNTPQIQASNYMVGNTPGVIGAQEVYRDPRQRIEKQRMQQEQQTRSVGPEKLTFREKMKMFAKETGEDKTPKDKVKTSRAQRDIESNLNGTASPNR